MLFTAPPGTAGSVGCKDIGHVADDSTVQVTPKSNDFMTFTVDEQVLSLFRPFPVATIITPLVATDVETDTNAICCQQ